MKNTLIKQIEFEHWANSELLTCIKNADNIEERTLVLFSHILSASNMWLSRVKGETINTTLFQERTINECEDLLKENTFNWLNYIESCSSDDLNQIIVFISPLDGIKRKVLLIDAILHIVHHSSYHRGQMVTQLKGKIERLPLITFIAYCSTEI